MSGKKEMGKIDKTTISIIQSYYNNTVSKKLFIAT